MQKDTVTAFRNVLRRIYAKENKEKYHLICTKTSNQDEERIWELCKAFCTQSIYVVHLTLKSTSQIQV